MATLQQHLEKVKKLTEKQITDDLVVFIRSIEKELVLLNKNQIQIDSEDIFGKALGFYSQATELITGGEKKAGQPFTGYDTGDWLSEFRLMPVKDGFQFWSSDKKTSTILASPSWLSHDVFGLTDENLRLVIKLHFTPYFINYLKDALQ